MREPQRHYPIRSGLLKAYAFQKTSDGYYKPGSLTEVSHHVEVKPIDEATVQVSLTNPKYEGYYCFFMGKHYYHYADTFSDYFIESYRNAIDHYSHIPFQGIVLDEFKNLPVHAWDNPFMRERFYGKSFSEFFQQNYGEYRGVMAIKVDKEGNLEKFACGAFWYLRKNGFTILQSKDEKDIALCDGRICDVHID